MTTSDPYLYILMRTDMASMNPGKAMAQAAHAANLCQSAIQTHYEYPHDFYHLWNAWDGGRGFGTTITLDTPQWKIGQLALNTGDPEAGVGVLHGALYGVVTDPTYPLRDGSVTHLLSIDTCGFVFGRKDDIGVRALVDGLDLHK